jgi:hypothetical protein
MTEPAWLQLTTGDAIPASKTMGWGWMAFGGLCLAVGAGVYYFLGWQQIAVLSAITGLLTIFLGSTTAFGNRRVVIAPDCVQEARAENTVTTHIPFANIAELRLVDHMPQFIGINLRDIADPLSYCKTGFASLKERNGFDHVIVEEWDQPAKEIYRRLSEKHRAFLAKGETAQS